MMGILDRNVIIRWCLIFFCLMLFFQALPASAAASLANTLKNNSSPYLELHADDPVNWQQWGTGVLDYARQHNRLIYISTGFFSCHWCHVMQRESFQNPAIARLLNEHFVPVKIDREMNPALDSYLIDFVRETEGIAGWPLNVIITPEGYPVYGTVYQPPEKFEKLLNNIIETWKSESEKASRLAREAAEYKLQYNNPMVTTKVEPEVFSAQLLSDVFDNMDEFQGGFGEQSRFPMAPRLSVLLDLYRVTKNTQLGQWLLLTLDQIKNKGLRDHIHGGFFRYTVDPAWTEPHYEKMLYTQAMLSSIFLEAAEILERPDYLEVARDTLAFVSREMQSESGGYLSSFSAVDNNDDEGAAYLWSLKQLSAVLNENELALVKRYWFKSFSNNANLAALPLFHQQIQSGPDAQKLESIRLKLRQAGRLKTIPVDNKVITAWNALLLSAYSVAADKLDDDNYRHLAKQLRDKLINDHWKDAKLYRTGFGKKHGASAHLEDYVFLAQGLKDFAVMNASQEDWYLSNLLLAKAWLLFWHSNGWENARDSLLPGMQPKAALPDSDLPAADAILVYMSLNSGNSVLQDKAEHAVELMFKSVEQTPLEMSSHYWWINHHRFASD